MQKKSNFTKYGMLMYYLCLKGSLFLHKHIWLYYLLAHTWGLIMTLIGYVVSIALLITGHLPYKYYNTYYFKVGCLWGGLEFGTCFIRDRLSSERVNYHELGHTYQNALLGPLFIFLVAIPSAIRYWHIKLSKKNVVYDDIWFEGSATDIGNILTK